MIANAYLRGWFPLDAVSIAASLFDFLPFWLAAGDTKLKSLTVLRVVRILRLIKLLRLLKASRVLKSWAVKIPTPRATVTILSSLAECMFCLAYDRLLARPHGGARRITARHVARDARLLHATNGRGHGARSCSMRTTSASSSACRPSIGTCSASGGPGGCSWELQSRYRRRGDRTRPTTPAAVTSSCGFTSNWWYSCSRSRRPSSGRPSSRALRAGLQQSRSRHARLPHGVGRAQPFRELLQGLQAGRARAAATTSSARISRAQSRASSS